MSDETSATEDALDDNTDSVNWQTSNSITEIEISEIDKPLASSNESLKESPTSSTDINTSQKQNSPDQPASENENSEKKTYGSLKSKILKPFLNEDNELLMDLTKYFRSTTNAITILAPQEPWPKDVQLFQPYEVEQILLPDNANCLAVQTFLKMCQLEYKVEARVNADAMSPTGRVPFIKCGAFIVSELEGIVQFVGSKGIALTADLDAESKADMRAYMTLVNNVLGNAELYLCWCDPETYNQVTKPRFGSVHPWPLNYIQTWSKRQDETKRLKVIGWYQKSLEEVYNDVETCCQALTDRLDNNNYFFGSQPTELEALIFGHLYTILTTPLPNAALANIVKNFPKLIDLITRLEKKYFQRETQH